MVKWRDCTPSFLLRSHSPLCIDSGGAATSPSRACPSVTSFPHRFCRFAQTSPSDPSIQSLYIPFALKRSILGSVP